MSGMSTPPAGHQVGPAGLAIDPPADRIRIVSTPGVRGGRPRLDGRRITVADVVVWHERQGLGPDEIVDQHPGVTLSDVYAALAYYFENRERIDADIRRDEQAVDAIRDGRPSLLETLRRRKSDAPGDPLPSG